MNITAKEKEIIEEFLFDFDLDIRTDYSGRGMYGQTCIGISGYFGNKYRFLYEFIQFLNAENLDELAETMFNNAVEDSMGRGMILYFPSVSFEEE